MKIDESCIDHNAVLCIKDAMACIWDTMDKDDNNIRIGILGEINGILELADALKEVIKT